ncbi:glycosyltransferase family 25 protein [Myriangium duriaei CBS 260.36]|uniref:Glycosyltransferase family 25 protein n=1 Tax=Myriangium duriaei CBS 260.36 TaxID=1168546 RepID=A0A9P4MDX9_9PEZI|nr:glycosyltransferase family 25 protein [Myriangium duriaei CBS 260.36]
MIHIRPLGLATLLLLVVLSLVVLLAPRSQSWRIDSTQASAPDSAGDRDVSAGNSTLGFEKILALSSGTRWRVDGLQAAANASGIEILVPQMPNWSEEWVRSFSALGPIDKPAAATAWLEQIDLLKLVVMNRWNSALILEEMVDWDVRIRQQTVNIAKGVKDLARKSNAILSWSQKKKDTHSPYGDGWDVLWFGHASDPLDEDGAVVTWKDETVISHEGYKGKDKHVTFVLKEGERGVHQSVNPMCTFAYAVSVEGASKVLQWAGMGKGRAFDLMLSKACKEGKLKCVTVNPEIFDEYHPVGGDAGPDVAKGKGKAKAAIEKEMGHSDNILMSARCQALWGKNCTTEP